MAQLLTPVPEVNAFWAGERRKPQVKINEKYIYLYIYFFFPQLETVQANNTTFQKEN